MSSLTRHEAWWLDVRLEYLDVESGKHIYRRLEQVDELGWWEVADRHGGKLVPCFHCYSNWIVGYSGPIKGNGEALIAR